MLGITKLQPMRRPRSKIDNVRKLPDELKRAWSGSPSSSEGFEEDQEDQRRDRKI